MIRVRNARRGYRTGNVTHEVLRDVNLDIERGELVALIGRSGSGKTTLLNIIGGLDSTYTGTVEVNGQDLCKLSERELSEYRNRQVGFVFQSFQLLDHMTCLDNVTLPSLFARGEGALDEHAARERGLEVLDLVGLKDKIDTRPRTLSGGQKQRVAIARALYAQPLLILCDEPTGNLDSATGAAILELFQKLNAEQKITLLIVTHEDPISSAANRVIRIQDGLIVEGDGDAAEATETGKKPDASGDPPPDREAATP